MISVLQRTAPVIASKSRERQSRVSNASMLTLWEIISDSRLESNSRALLRKLDFFFGDSIEEDEAILYDGNLSGSVKSVTGDSSSGTCSGCIS